METNNFQFINNSHTVLTFLIYLAWWKSTLTNAGMTLGNKTSHSFLLSSPSILLGQPLFA